MKKFLALILCCAMVFMTACSFPYFSDDTAQIQPTEEMIFEEIPEETEETIPTTPKLEIRENPVSDWTEENIEPFGNTPGHVIARGVEEFFPDARVDGNRICFETDRLIHTPQMKTYAVDQYVEKSEKLLDAIESATGFSFPEKKVQLILGDSGKRTSDFDYGSFVDAKYRLVQFGQCDAFLGNGNDLISLLSFVLLWEQAPQRFCDVLESGFATYTAYDLLCQLEVSDPEFAALFAGSHRLYSNYYLFDPDCVYSNPLNYWLENGYPYEASNGSPAMGFWLMKYFEDVCGDYTAWVTNYNAENGELDIDAQIQLLKDTYGEDAWYGFYPWLRENLDKSAPWNMVPDHTNLHKLVCYPLLTEVETPQELLNGEYADICISFAEYRHYLTQVKEFTIDAITLIKHSDAPVLLYDAEGTFLQATTGTQAIDGSYLVSLDDAYYVRFPDAGYYSAQLDLEYTYP